MSEQKPSNTTLVARLAECYRLSGADPDGNEDWRLAEHAVAAVRDLREELDASEAHCAALEARLRACGGPTDPEAFVQWVHRLIAKCERCDRVEARLRAVEQGIREAVEVCQQTDEALKFYTDDWELMANRLSALLVSNREPQG